MASHLHETPERTAPRQRPRETACGRLRRFSSRPDLLVSYQYNLRPSCICRGRLAWVVIRPNVLLLKSVFGRPHTMRLNTLKASTRMSISRLFEALIDLATLMFSVKFQGRRTSGLMRGAFPSSPIGCTNAARFRYLSTVGLNVSPAIGARQSAPVTLGRFVPL